MTEIVKALGVSRATPHRHLAPRPRASPVPIRGKPVARLQWQFECSVHNLLKLHRNGGLALILTG